MPSDTKNVKLGVCSVWFNGINLGFTKGGVEVEVTTETYEVEVDQFGKSPIDDVIMGREITAKVPLAETTLDNLVRVMPGAQLVTTGGGKASGTITFAAQPAANDTLTVNGVVFTFVAALTTGNQILIGAAAAATAANTAAALNASLDQLVGYATYSAAAAVVTVQATDFGVYGNAITLAKSGAAPTLSGATLAGGAEPTKKKAVVNRAIGQSLLAIAKPLVLHPIANAATNRADDVNIPLAATPGAFTYAFKLDEERIFNVTFKGYPNPNTGELFTIGDPTAA